MHFESVNPRGDASHTYLIADERVAVIVDPRLDRVDTYLERLETEGLRLVGVIDTHTHADYLSGASEITKRTGAPLLMHHQAPRACVHRRLRDGDEVPVGHVLVRVLSTPGHTYDSITLMLPERLLVGDFFGPGPEGHGDEACGDVEAWRDGLERLRKLDPTLMVYGTHGDSGPRVLPVAVGEASRREFEGLMPHSSRMGLDFREPKDERVFDALRANLACSPAATPGGRGTAEIRRIKPSDLAEAVRSTTPPHIIDVRSLDEAREPSLGRVPGAYVVPLERLEAEGEALRALGGPLVLSCRSTARAVLAASILQRAGIDDVAVLEGGVLAWKAEGHPVELS